MTLLEAIQHRTAVRNYTGLPVEKQECVDALLQHIEQYNAQAGLSILWISDGAAAFQHSRGMFAGVRSVIALKGNKDTPHLFEKLGLYGELLVLRAVALGLDTCWVGGTFDKQNAVFQLQPQETLASVITVGHNSGTTTLVNRLARRFTHKKKPVSDLFQAVGNPPQWFHDGMDAVQKAPSALNRQSVFFQYDNGVVTAGINGKNTLEPVDLLDLGIAKSHFNLAAGGQFEYGNNGVFQKKEN